MKNNLKNNLKNKKKIGGFFMKNNLRNKKKKGFTLIELIIVIAIIALIALIALPRFGGAAQDARKNSELANAKNIANAVTMAIADGTNTFGATATAVTEANLGNQLQSIPKTEAGTDFYVIVDNGDVKVYSDAAASVQVYPAP